MLISGDNYKHQYNQNNSGNQDKNNQLVISCIVITVSGIRETFSSILPKQY